MIKKNTENTDRCKQFATESRNTIEKGHSSIEELQHSISSISESNQKISNEIDVSQNEMKQVAG